LGEVDEDLEGETAEECSKYGIVTKCTIYEVKGEHVSPQEAVRIFVKFKRDDMAQSGKAIRLK
jgi:splicing factor 45